MSSNPTVSDLEAAVILLIAPYTVLKPSIWFQQITVTTMFKLSHNSQWLACLPAHISGHGFDLESRQS